MKESLDFIDVASIKANLIRNKIKRQVEWQLWLDNTSNSGSKQAQAEGFESGYIEALIDLGLLESGDLQALDKYNVKESDNA